MFYTGQTINKRYKICELLGEGGTSLVYKAEDHKTGTPVAVKFMKEKVTTKFIEDIIRFKREIEIVKKIYNLYLENWGIRRIVDLFNGDGIKFRNGKDWNVSTVYYILGNPFYYGCLMYGRHSQDSNWRLANEPLTNIISEYIEPAITKEIFDKVQELKHKKNVNISGISGRTYRSQHLLTGILYCRKCGHAMGGLNPSTGRKFYYYGCKGYQNKGRSFCDGANIQQNILDKIVIKDMKKYFFPEENRLDLIEKLSGKYERDIKNLEINLNSLIKEEINLKKQFGRIEKDYRIGKLEIDDFNRMKSEILEEISENEILIREKEFQLDKLKTNIIDPEVINNSANILLNWNNLSIDDKKLFLSIWVVKICVYKSKDKNINNGEMMFEPTYIWDIKKEG
jgi:site-specific DNA recombinase